MALPNRLPSIRKINLEQEQKFKKRFPDLFVSTKNRV